MDGQQDALGPTGGQQRMTSRACGLGLPTAQAVGYFAEY